MPKGEETYQMKGYGSRAGLDPYRHILMLQGLMSIRRKTPCTHLYIEPTDIY